MADKGLLIITASGGCLRAVHATPDVADLLTVEFIDYDDYETMNEDEAKAAETEARIAELGMKCIF